MGRYIGRRVLQLIPVFFGATFLIFAMVYALPGDPVRALTGVRPQSPAVAEVIRERYNLNDPLYEQYAKYLWGLLHGDFGSDLQGRKVSAKIADTVPRTVRLAAIAFVFEVIVGVGAGILAGVRQRGFFDTLVLVTTLIVISIPIFVLGFLAQLMFGVEWKILPTSRTDHGWKSYVLPGLVLGSVSLAFVARLTRSTLLDHLKADYVRTGTSKGLSRKRVVGIHAMRNSLIPVVTFLGINLAELLGGAIITETVFSINGVGLAIRDGVDDQQGAVVVGLTTFVIIVYMALNLLVDILYALLDPRIRYE